MFRSSKNPGVARHAHNPNGPEWRPVGSNQVTGEAPDCGRALSSQCLRRSGAAPVVSNSKILRSNMKPHRHRSVLSHQCG